MTNELNIEQERREFEAENITGRYYRCSAPGCSHLYEDSHTQLAWNAWIAAKRAAIPAITLEADALAQEIRRVDGNHSLGAGALAEALMPFIEHAAMVSSEPVAIVKSIDGTWACVEMVGDGPPLSPGDKLFTAPPAPVSAEPTKHASAENYLRGKYGAYRGHHAWRELEEAFNAGADGVKRERVSVPPFPTMLRKMWTGAEVQAWINQNIGPAQEGKAS